MKNNTITADFRLIISKFLWTLLGSQWVGESFAFQSKRRSFACLMNC